MTDARVIPISWSALTIDQLQTFQLVSQSRSFSRTADSLFITASAVSQRINALERIVGVPLLERERGQTPRLTPAGERLLAFCDRQALELTQLATEIDSLRLPDVAGLLAIIAPPSLVQYLLPLMAGTFRQQVPNVKIRLIPSFEYEAIYRSVRSGEADIGILPEASAPDSILMVPFFIDQLILATSAKHRLSVMGPGSVAELVGKPFVLPPRGTVERQLAERWAASVGLELNVVVETASDDAMKHAAITLGMFTIVSRLAAASELNSQLLAAIDMPGFPMERTLYLVSKNEAGMSDLARTFLRTIARSALSAHTPAVVGVESVI
jgi:DNA-binding transcriptional LysR family regulator